MFSLQARIRIPMNSCLGITHDKDVRHINTRVSSRVLKNYLEGKELDKSERPQARPMRLDYEGGRGSRWNHEVWESFLPVLAEEEAKRKATMSDAVKSLYEPKNNGKETFMTMGTFTRVRALFPVLVRGTNNWFAVCLM